VTACDLSRTIDALDNWCLRRILNIHWSKFVTIDEIRSRTGQPFLSDTVRSRRLSFIGHLYQSDPGHDHHRALQACIAGPPDNWRRKIGRPRQSWLRTVEADLRPMNLGLATAKRRAQDRSAWRKLVATATSSQIEEIVMFLTCFCAHCSASMHCTMHAFPRLLSFITAARSGVCRYGRLLYSAPVFFFFLFNESP